MGESPCLRSRSAGTSPTPGHLAAQEPATSPPSQRQRTSNTDRWYFRIFQSAPDLIRALLPGALTTAELEVDPTEPADHLYRFSAPELKELSHRLDGVLWPREVATGSEAAATNF